MQIPSLLQIEAECRHGALAKRIGPISDDTLGYSLERQSPEPVFALRCEIARRLKRNGVLRSDWSRGLVVGAVDGIEICSSFARCCDACREREVQPKGNGEMKTGIQYYHRIVVVVLVSTSFPIPPGCPLSEERRRRGRLRLGSAPGSGRAVGPPLPGWVGGRRFISASALRPASGASGSGLGLHLEREPARLIARGRALHAASSHRSSGRTRPGDSILALAGPRLARRRSPGAGRQNRSPRIPATGQDQRKRRSSQQSQDPVAQPSTNFYATNFELGSISPLFIHQFSRSRWRIDTEVFHTLTVDCHLKHAAVHQTTALVVLTMIRFLAYTLSLVFYHRQVCSHARRKCDTFHELAKRFAYWFLALSPNTS
jgi:hypothetical protein